MNSKVTKHLRKGTVAAVGVEGQQSLVGKVVGWENGVVELMEIDSELRVPVYERRSFYRAEDVCDYEWADSLGHTFSDEDGTEVSAYDHLMSFVLWWNETGNGERR